MKTVSFYFLSVVTIGIFLEYVQAETAIDVDKQSACDHVSNNIDVLKSSVASFQLDLDRYQHEVKGKFDTLKSHQNNNQIELKQIFQSMEKYSNPMAITNVLLEFTGKKANSQICVRSIDQTLVCTAVVYPTSCAEHDSPLCAKGKCRIQNVLYGSNSFLVSCDDTTDGGGWTVIQRRIDGAVDFNRGWSEYKKGFGNIDGEFWIGLDKLHALTSTLAPVELLIKLKDHNGTLKYAKYGKFSIGSELEMYELKEADDYDGNAGDSFSYHKGYKFTTKDKDNDGNPLSNTAVDSRGAWWYEDCDWSNLNGFYHKPGDDPENEYGNGIHWGSFHGFNYSMKFVQMMIRPKYLKGY